MLQLNYFVSISSGQPLQFAWALMNQTFIVIRGFIPSCKIISKILHQHNPKDGVNSKHVEEPAIKPVSIQTHANMQVTLTQNVDQWGSRSLVKRDIHATHWRQRIDHFLSPFILLAVPYSLRRLLISTIYLIFLESTFGTP